MTVEQKAMDESVALEVELEALRRRVRDLEARERERADFLERTEYALRFNQFAMDSLPDAMYWIEGDARISYVNEAACKMVGYSEDELLELRVYELNPDQSKETWPIIWDKLRTAGRRTFETRHQAKDGEIIPVEVSANLFEFGGEEYSIAFVRDIRDRKRLEYRLRHEEKMTAIGQLAGGIAHDFNNQLMGIMGYADILREEVAANPDHAKLAVSIVRAAMRSAELTSQLLAFSRRGKYVTEPVDLHVVVREVTDILTHSIDKKIRIECKLSAKKATVLGDSSQLQSAILNLALNSRDAMPTGGSLTFETETRRVGANFACNPPFELAHGDYICLTVRDTGAGIPPDIQHRVFEPFFTTKASAKGTGLGLAAVYGTMKNHQGAINLRSSPTDGTSIELYLPSSSEELPSRIRAEDEASSSETSRRVLVVEDEAVLRDVASRMLSALGYEVITFSNGAQAVDYFKAHADTIDLVVLDMVMPVMNGRETFLAMKQLKPDLRAVLASGYSLDGDAQSVMDEGAMGFIQKPYRREALGDLLRRVLDPPEPG